MKKLLLSGVYAPIPTPFDADGAVAHDRLAENVARWSQTPLAGLIVLGSNGEFTYLNDKEKLKVLKRAEVVFCCAARGVRIIDMELLKQLEPKKVMVDTNAVAPHGIEGLTPNDYMKEIVPGIYGIGALVIGDLKFKLQREMLARMRASEKPGVFDYDYALELAREILRKKAVAPATEAKAKEK